MNSNPWLWFKSYLRSLLILSSLRQKDQTHLTFSCQTYQTRCQQRKCQLQILNKYFDKFCKILRRFFLKFAFNVKARKAGPEKKIILAMTGTLLLPQTRSNLEILSCFKATLLNIVNHSSCIEWNVQQYLLGGDSFFPNVVVELKVIAGVRTNILEIE